MRLDLSEMDRKASDAELEQEPERKLLEAILQDAIECWQRCAVVATTWSVSGYSSMGKRQKDYREADFWFFGEYDNAPYFSFTRICDCLGLDPDFIRRCLLDWKRSQMNGLPFAGGINTSEARPRA